MRTILDKFKVERLSLLTFKCVEMEILYTIYNFKFLSTLSYYFQNTFSFKKLTHKDYFIQKNVSRDGRLGGGPKKIISI